jgi:FkbM family methyltransferase
MPEWALTAAMPDSDTKTLQTRFGPMMGLAGDRYITGSLEAYGEFSVGEWELFDQIVKPGMTVVEVGANIGAHSIPLARKCFPGRLFLFEPQQRIFQLLCANLALNGIRNAIALPEAGSDGPGFVVVPPLDYGAPGNFGGVSVRAEAEGVRGLRVRATPLDSLGLAICHVIKIDVEGFEPQVLRGAEKTIRGCRPVLYVENDREANQQEVISLIADMGYTMYWHLPPLFNPRNFNGNSEDIFGNIVSINILALPTEQGSDVAGVTPIDPANWTSPVKLSL